jgi:parallel beta-helix repeat protein
LWGGHAAAAEIMDNDIISNTNMGMFLWECDNAMIIGNNISHNSNGGGLWTNGDNVTIQGNTISHNTADWFAGVDINDESENVRFTGNTISFNTAVYGGGGVSFSGNGDLVGNSFISNTAGGSGGGLYLHDSSGEESITGNTFIGNSASEGGAMVLAGGNPLLTNNIMVDNQVTNNGSAIHITEGVTHTRLVHNTLARNQGGDGSGIYIYGTTIALTNTIIVSHTVGIYIHFDASASFESTLWGNGIWSNGLDWDGAGTMNPSNNHWGNPDFVDYLAGDYHIGANSDAIDAGISAGVTGDIDNQPRPYQTPDIGADEYWPPGVLKHIFLPLVTR